MPIEGIKETQSWQGKNINVTVLYSRPGVGQHIWVNIHDNSVLVDTGDGVLRDLLNNKFDLKQLRGIIYTHGHFDHVGGLYTLLGFLRMVGRTQPLLVFTPKACHEVSGTIDNFMKSYADTTPFEIIYREIEPYVHFQIAGMTIMAYPVIHCGSTKEGGILDPIPALGYRLTYSDEVVAISGDTGFCTSLKELITDADLAIIEAVYESSDDATQESLNNVHLSEDVAKKLGRLARKYILVHKGKRRKKYK